MLLGKPVLLQSVVNAREELMVKQRPYFNSSIEDLESIFAIGKQDANLLRALAAELEHRKTGRARNLAKVVGDWIVKHDVTPEAEEINRVAESDQVSVDSDTEYQEEFNPPRDSNSRTGTTSRAHDSEFTNEVSNIINSWTALEVLAPQGFKKEEDLAGGQKKLITYLNSDSLPWERGEKSLPKKRLYYEIILGTINVGSAVERLLKVYGDNRPDAQEIRSHSPIASFMVDKEGRPLDEDSCLVISSFAWGVPVALSGDLKRLAGWASEERQLTNELKSEILKKDSSGEVPILTAEKIESLYSQLSGMLQLEGLEVKTPYFGLRRYEYFGNKNPPEPGLLNSFYLADLLKVQKMAVTSKLPFALSYYLGERKPVTKSNLLDDKAAIRSLLQPSKTPLGSWPAAGRFPLALLQQAAVNGTTESIKDTGILAVNGPPGTGKTTLLRDVIAARIVERANVMVEYADPETAFTASKESFQRSGAKITLHHPDDKLKGFEMVVASSNNKAVENVSAELPTLDAIASDAKDLRYFSSISDNVLQSETWGAISAVLGKSSNRYTFSQSFWRDPELGLSTYLNHAAGSPQFVLDTMPDGSTKKRLRKIVELENPPANQKEARIRWKQARDGYKKAVEKAREKRAWLQARHEQLSKLQEFIEERDRNSKQIPALVQSLENGYEKQRRLANGVYDREDKLAEAKRAVVMHKNNRPNIILRFFNTKSARIWKAVLKDRTELLRKARYELELAFDRLEEAESFISSSQIALSNAQLLAETLESDISGIEKSISEFRNQRNASIPDEEFFNQSHEKIQCEHLWFDQLDSEERHTVFIEAMNVHRAFIDCAADPIRQNLAIFIESFGTRSLGSAKKDQKIPDLWATFFMVMPVVSTTFASVTRMFERVPNESLGWLLIDEAGQALPQAAVGAIMRSRHVVAVGDPMQIEPVVGLPYTLTGEICRSFAIDPLIYNAPEASVQTLADAASVYSGRFPSGSGYREVGLPLLVHRRCDSPMFDISNEIAYANLMVQAKTPSTAERALGPSCWVDVIGESGPDKWCETEATVLIQLLEKLRVSGAEPDLYIVTPFRIVQNNLRDRLKRSGVLEGWVSKVNSWVFTNIGTVHTVQGREAPLVFFVLGAQGASHTGARAWAGGSPNLVNVAVTRSKTSLYVIGNRKLWSGVGTFRTLDTHLPVYSKNATVE